MPKRADTEGPWIGSSHRFVIVFSGSKRDAEKAPNLWRGFVSYTPPTFDPAIATERRVGFSALEELPVILRGLVTAATGTTDESSGGGDAP